jgi:hypothetical protein
MAVTHDIIVSAREYLDKIVVPDFEEFESDTTSLRKAFHCAQSLFHLHDWVFQDHKPTFSDCSDEKCLSQKLAAESRDFAIIRDIANASKHMSLRGGVILDRADAVSIQSTTFGEGPYGVGPYGGSPRVRIRIDDHDEEFQTLAKNTLNMWLKMFESQHW